MKALYLVILVIALGTPGCRHPSATSQGTAAVAPGKPEDPKLRYEAGKMDAARDIKSGRLSLHAWQDDRKDDSYARLLKSKYGVELRIQPGKVTETTDAYAHGYNEVMCVELQRKFGEDVLDRMADDVIKLEGNKSK